MENTQDRNGLADDFGELTQQVNRAADALLNVGVLLQQKFSAQSQGEALAIAVNMAALHAQAGGGC